MDTWIHTYIRMYEDITLIQQSQVLLVKLMLNKNTLGVTKVRGQSEAAL